MIRTIYFAHDHQESPEQRWHLLELSGFVVKTFSNHPDLAEALTQRSPSLVLIDTLLEGRNGFEAAREIHVQFPRREFPIVLCTTVYRPQPFVEEARRCGAQDYLVLPMAPDEFLRRVGDAIAHFAAPGGRAAVA